MTAGALALAVIAPALDPVEHAAEAVIAPPQALPATPELPVLPLREEIQERQLRASSAADDPLRQQKWEIPLRAGLEERLTAEQRASRSVPRRMAARVALRQSPMAAPASRRPIRLNTGPAARVAERSAGRFVERPAGRIAERPSGRIGERSASRVTERSAARGAGPAARVAERPATRAGERSAARFAAREAHAQRRVVVQQRRTTVSRRGALAVRTSTRTTAVRRLRANPGRSMNAVIAFARSQVGKRYVRGGDGPGGFDCSGFTKRAYARAGLRLPHSSGEQARRARTVSRANARPGDLVIGPGHVGIYMGRGMMIDAGNHRTGVVYRKLYRGLRVARL
ncbi:C40 family peptidase [Actinoplanes sp. GCM10030250]|uniref:C40 family peptidase n=1 Tax=Actinoplanes sp. GCM10030250 TaxID=3273376 RepID=UPI00361D2EED